MGRGESPDEPWDHIGSASTSIPAPHDRTWRHPSELGHHVAPSSIPLGGAQPLLVDTPTPVDRRRRFSAGSLILAAALGAVMMFVVLAAMDMVGGSDADSTTDPHTVAADARGVVTLRIERPDATRIGSGLVFDDGYVMTVIGLGTDPTNTVVSIAGAADTWVQLKFVALDHATGVAVLSGVESDMVAAEQLTSANLGDHVRFATATPASGSISVRERTQRVVSTTGSVATAERTIGDLLTLTAPAGTVPADVVVDRRERIVGLVVEADDDPSDQLVYAIPVSAALDVAHGLVRDAASVPGAS